MNVHFYDAGTQTSTTAVIQCALRILRLDEPSGTRLSAVAGCERELESRTREVAFMIKCRVEYGVLQKPRANPVSVTPGVLQKCY